MHIHIKSKSVVRYTVNYIYSILLHLYQRDENVALDTHMRYLLIVVSSSIKHFNTNIVKMFKQNSTCSGHLGLVLKSFIHEKQELKCIPD